MLLSLVVDNQGGIQLRNIQHISQLWQLRSNILDVVLLMYLGRKACLIVVKKDPWGNGVLGVLVIEGVFDFSSHRREASRIQHFA